MVERRQLLGGIAAAWAVSGCRTLLPDSDEYSVSILGDTHFDAEPDSIYHAHYQNEGKAEWLWKVQRQEFARNGEMWRDRCRRLLAASAKVAHATPSTDFILQLGDIIQGDWTLEALKKKNDRAKIDGFQKDIAPFKRDLKEFFFNWGAGHFRLNVGESRVTMDYFPGDATTPARTFVMKET